MIVSWWENLKCIFLVFLKCALWDTLLNAIYEGWKILNWSIFPMDHSSQFLLTRVPNILSSNSLSLSYNLPEILCLETMKYLDKSVGWMEDCRKIWIPSLTFTHMYEEEDNWERGNTSKREQAQERKTKSHSYSLWDGSVVKSTCNQACQPAFDAQNPHGGRRELTSESFSQTSICMSQYMHNHTYTHTVYINCPVIRNNGCSWWRAHFQFPAPIWMHRTLCNSIARRYNAISDTLRHQTCTWCTYIQVGKILICIK